MTDTTTVIDQYNAAFLEGHPRSSSTSSPTTA
jgi:hypothetical protein